MESQCQLKPDLEQVRDQMLAEFHSLMAATYGSVQGGIRLARVVALCSDLGVRFLPPRRVQVQVSIITQRLILDVLPRFRGSRYNDACIRG